MPTNLEERVDKLYMDMYIGEGKSNPPMTTRISLLEDQMEKINKNLSKITWLLAGAASAGGCARYRRAAAGVRDAVICKRLWRFVSQRYSLKTITELEIALQRYSFGQCPHFLWSEVPRCASFSWQQ